MGSDPSCLRPRVDHADPTRPDPRADPARCAELLSRLSRRAGRLILVTYVKQGLLET